MARIRRVVMPKNTQTKLLKEKTRIGKTLVEMMIFMIK